jgi:hypothetical protein
MDDDASGASGASGSAATPTFEGEPKKEAKRDAEREFDADGESVEAPAALPSTATASSRALVTASGDREKWSAQNLAALTGDDSALPEIMINGKMKKVSKREHHKWNDTGSGAHDDHHFAKVDAELCA